MGVFSTVIAIFECSRCRRDYSSGVQFKTEDDESMPHFQEHERVTGIAPGTYEGIVNAYCDPCMLQWSDDERVASLAALAASVARGELVVRRGSVLRDAHGAPIPDERNDFRITLLEERARTAAEIAAAGHAPETEFGWRSFAAHLDQLDYVLFDGEERIFPTRRTSRSDWWQRHREEVGRLLEARGWIHGDEQWIEPSVVVSNELVVTVQRSERNDRTDD